MYNLVTQPNHTTLYILNRPRHMHGKFPLVNQHKTKDLSASCQHVPATSSTLPSTSSAIPPSTSSTPHSLPTPHPLPTPLRPALPLPSHKLSLPLTGRSSPILAPPHQLSLLSLPVHLRWELSPAAPAASRAGPRLTRGCLPLPSGRHPPASPPHGLQLAAAASCSNKSSASPAPRGPAVTVRPPLTAAADGDDDDATVATARAGRPDLGNSAADQWRGARPPGRAGPPAPPPPLLCWEGAPPAARGPRRTDPGSRPTRDPAETPHTERSDETTRRERSDETTRRERPGESDPMSASPEWRTEGAKEGAKERAGESRVGRRSEDVDDRN